MKCFTHPSVDAVATCKACCRALCRDCVAEVGRSCACRGRCEEDVLTMNDLVERGRTAYQKSSATFLRTGIFVSVVGAAFVALGLGALRRDDASFGAFLLFMGVVFVGFGASNFRSAQRIAQK